MVLCAAKNSCGLRCAFGGFGFVAAVAEEPEVVVVVGASVSAFDAVVDLCAWFAAELAGVLVSAFDVVADLCPAVAVVYDAHRWLSTGCVVLWISQDMAVAFAGLAAAWASQAAPPC